MKKVPMSIADRIVFVFHLKREEAQGIYRRERAGYSSEKFIKETRKALRDYYGSYSVLWEELKTKGIDFSYSVEYESPTLYVKCARPHDYLFGRKEVILCGPWRASGRYNLRVYGRGDPRKSIIYHTIPDKTYYEIRNCFFLTQGNFRFDFCSPRLEQELHLPTKENETERIKRLGLTFDSEEYDETGELLYYNFDYKGEHIQGVYEKLPPRKGYIIPDKVESQSDYTIPWDEDGIGKDFSCRWLDPSPMAANPGSIKYSIIESIKKSLREKCQGEKPSGEIHDMFEKEENVRFISYDEDYWPEAIFD